MVNVVFSHQGKYFKKTCGYVNFKILALRNVKDIVHGKRSLTL